MPTFGDQPEDRVVDRAGDPMANLPLELYPTEADALAQTSLLASPLTNSEGLWPIDLDRTVLWVRVPGGAVYERQRLAPQLTIGTVVTGAPGTPAAVTITGTHPHYTLNLTLPRGDGMVIVNHGADPNVARPANVAMVYWVGAARPAAALPTDLWKNA